MRRKIDTHAARLIPVTPRYWQVVGDLTLASVAALALETKRLLQQCPPVLDIDLSGIEQAHSAGLALLFDWHHQAYCQGCQLYYAHWPAALLRLAALSHMESLIGMCSRPPEQALSRTAIVD